MKLISWNVNGLRAVLGKDGFAWLAEQNPDFLGLQEIKVSEKDAPKGLYELGFSQIDLNSAARAGYSGVASLAKFKSETSKALFFPDDEGRVLQHRFGDVVLFNIYFPNGQKDEARLAYKMEFYAKFLAYARSLAEQGLGVIFCGDVNTAHREIDLANPKANSKTSGFCRSSGRGSIRWRRLASSIPSVPCTASCETPTRGGATALTRAQKT